jgi:DNA (cytosine-5)-methyltransferase 1
VRILETFSGYGTASFALKRLGITYDLVGYSDIDKYANQCFKQNHCPWDVEDKLRLGDIKLINPYELDDFDLLTGGFPCQAFSAAGKGQGELDHRGTLFNEIIRIAEVKKPKYMLLENVKGFTFKKFKGTFDKVLSELDRIGYIVYWKVLNSKDYGIPQNRERVWFVCFRKDVSHSFCFPEPRKLELFLKDILEDEVDEKYYLSDRAVQGIMKSNYQERKPQSKDVCSALKVGGDVKCIFNPYNGKISETESGTIGTSVGTSTGKTAQLLIYNTICLNSKDRDGNQPKIQNRVYSSEGVSPAVITAFMPSIENKTQIRKLTPKECFRLMGFLNDEIKLEGLSNTQQYKLAGNGQDINVVSLIFTEMGLK